MRAPIATIILVSFLITSIIGPMPAHAQDEFHLPVPGVMVPLSPPLDPPILKGIKVHPDDPFRFDFILDRGESQLSNDGLKDESSKLIKYFLASLTIPETDLWVNLSPYEKDRIIPQSFGLTEMGRDLLAEDYMLKQITASLIYPEDAIGRKFWKRIYEESAKKFGTTNIPVNTFNKVWIVPDKAVVYENAKAGIAYVVESTLKVMLEQDYLALSHGVIPAKGRIDRHSQLLAGIHNKNDINALGSRIVREVVIPELTKEVNENKNFAKLRQVYNSLILATWYKKKIKDSILAQVYEDKKKVAGVGYKSALNTETIYQRYLQAFKKGVYNYIKEEQDPLTQQIIPRKYFSGGLILDVNAAMKTRDSLDQQDRATIGEGEQRDLIIGVAVSPADGAMSAPSVKEVIIEFKKRNPYINEKIGHRRQKFIDRRTLDDFIKAMGTDNPLIDNRLAGDEGKLDYVYNLLLFTVSKIKFRVWEQWLDRARYGETKEDAERTKALNREHAVRPLNLRLGDEIKMEDGFYLKLVSSIEPTDITYEIREPLADSKQLQNTKRISKLLQKVSFLRKDYTSVGTVHLGWDENTLSWVPIPPKGTEIVDAYRGQGLVQKAYSHLIDIFGVIRSTGITPNESSVFAQRMWERMGAKVEYVGYYQYPYILRTETGYAYVMRSKNKINQEQDLERPDRSMHSGIKLNIARISSDKDVIEALRRRIQAPQQKENRWLRITAFPQEALDFYKHWSSTRTDHIDTWFNGQVYRIPGAIYEKMATWFVQNKGFERKGYFLAEKTVDRIEVVDFLPMGSVATDPGGSANARDDEKTSQASFVIGMFFGKPEVAKAFDIDLQAQKELSFQKVSQGKEDYISIPAHSHHVTSAYPDGPSAADQRLSDNRVEFVYTLSKGQGYFFDNNSVAKVIRNGYGTDAAMLNKGGIDFTAARMDVKTQNADEGIKFHLDPAMLKQLQNAPGFVPVIINIQPMKNLEMFLGLADEKSISNHS